MRVACGLFRKIPCLPDESQGPSRERLAERVGELLLPDDGDRVGAAEDGDECSFSEEARLILMLPTDVLEVTFRHDRFQAISKVPDMAGMVDGRRGLHEIVHDRTSNRENFST